ncbi:MAG: hypothetical protein KGL62_00985 [Bradyrhizobium sp.]|uniref:hypothetical protein n=1 Tax=Bradyrhizobium sp. TaxID=376 RepID=UPI0023938062|nr:hypothetical protein [Bradyrhizobium sp.]MDE2600920.1 hypothetical protein [Bradyrhizobium sp.]
MTIKQLRILPPFAIGRLGSASEPMDNYTFDLDINPADPLGYRQLKAQPTLIVDENSGEIKDEITPPRLEFKHGGRIRPVAPFLEVYAITDTDETLQPLTTTLLRKHELNEHGISWRATVSNRKIVRRTGNHDDLIHAQTRWFSDHRSHTLAGRCANFISPEASVNFGTVRFIKPNQNHPEIRLRFTPAQGLIYGPDQPTDDTQAQDAGSDAYQISEDRAIYDRSKSWFGLGSPEHPASNQTLPPSLFAINPPAPSWLFDNVAISRGYFDDACDGFVEVQLALKDGGTLTAKARICAAPPAMAPDSLFVRTLADDLEQVINGPDVAPNEDPEVTRKRALDIIRRAYETVRFMNVAVMNGNDFKGRPALSLDSMPEEEAADTQRAIRPVMASGSVDTFAIMTLHQQVFAALQGGAAPWFLHLLRQPDEVADFTDRGRRKMPALMCGADNNYLALTWRQIDTIRKAAEGLPAPKPNAAAAAVQKGLTPKNLSAQISYEAKGNPISSRPVTSVANCCPGLEVDFRAVWRRLFKGIELREYDNLVIEVAKDCDAIVKSSDGGDLKPSQLAGHRLLRVVLPPENGGKEFLMMTPMWGPSSSDSEGKIRLTTSSNPDGMAAVEWSNALARILPCKGSMVRCDFSAEASDQQMALVEESDDGPKNYVSFLCEVQAFFEDDTAVISAALADAGELTQGLCSPWQNDYRECSCYYWASARPDYVNVEFTASGLSTGDNWMQRERSGSYVADDYADTRLLMYDELFARWEQALKFQIGGRDAPDETGGKT